MRSENQERHVKLTGMWNTKACEQIDSHGATKNIKHLDTLKGLTFHTLTFVKRKERTVDQMLRP